MEADVYLRQAPHWHFPSQLAVGLKSAAAENASPFYGVDESENQFCGAADADESPSSGAVGAEGGCPFLGAADVAGGSPFCDAVGVADVSPSCGAVGGAPACCGWCGTAQTGACAVADGTDQWESP